MDEMQMSMTIKVNFRIIFFDDYLRNRIVESLKEQFSKSKSISWNLNYSAKH